MEGISGDGDQSGDSLSRAVDRIGGDLLIRDEWSDYYAAEEFTARDQFLWEAEMLVSRLEEAEAAGDDEACMEILVELDRIKRFASALNGMRAYTLAAENDPNHALLYPEQIPVMRAICDHFERDSFDKRGGFAVLPTGFGKTVTFNEAIYATHFGASFADALQESGLRTLVVAETNPQVQQNHDKSHEHAKGRSLDIGIIDGRNKKVGEGVTHTTYASLLLEMRKPPEERIIKPEDYDMVIYDEAHLVLGENRRKTIKYFDHAMKLAFTATDRYHDDKQLSILFPDEITRMTIHEAQEKKLIAPHRNIVVKTKADMRHVPVASTGDFAKEVLYRSINTPERNAVAVETYLALHHGMKTIDFCGGIQHAKDLAKMYNEHGIPAAAVWGDMPEKEYERIMDAFAEGSLLHITNADLITTGFDMKSVECVYMLQPSSSELLVVQEAGRSGRTWSDKPTKVSYVVQFIDENYRIAPVLYAEEGLAGSAQHGWDGFVFPELADTSHLDFEIITDPLEVDLMAIEHRMAREARSKYPPEDWVSMDDIALLAGRPMSHINNALAKFRKVQNDLRNELWEMGIEPEAGTWLDIEEHSGRFINPVTDSGRKKYLSPELINRMAEHLRQFRVKDSVMWRRRAEVQVIFDRSSTWINDHLLYRARNREDTAHWQAKLVERPESIKEFEYFHYELYKLGAEESAKVRGSIVTNIEDLIVPPKRMKRESTIKARFEKKFGEGAYELALSRSRQTPLGWGNNAGSIAYEVRGKIVQYYTAGAERKLERVLKYDPRMNVDLTPVVDIIDETDIASLGVTPEQIESEVADLLAKDPSLGAWDIKQFFDEELGRFVYYGKQKIHVHIYEELVRALSVNKSAEAILEILEASPIMVRKDTEKPDEVPEEMEDEIEDLVPDEPVDVRAETRKPEPGTPASNDTNSLAQKLARTEEMFKRLRQNRQ